MVFETGVHQFMSRQLLQTEAVRYPDYSESGCGKNAVEHAMVICG